MKPPFLILFLITEVSVFKAVAQVDSTTRFTTPIPDNAPNKTTTVIQKKADAPPTEKDEIEFEKPFNFFAAAGAAYRLGDLYDVTVSPIDKTVQFEYVYPVITRVSLGLVWNPIPKTNTGYLSKYIAKKHALIQAGYEAYKAQRSNLAIALLINVFSLGYTSSTISSTPIDVGFGLGYRKDNFLILGTAEFTPMRAPKKYFVEKYKDKNQTLLYSGSEEPARDININDNSIFSNKVYLSFGIKVAYAFSKRETTN